jgi:hypothetical protein
VETTASIEHGPINSNKQIKQSNRSSIQTKTPREAFTWHLLLLLLLLLLLFLHLSRRHDKQCSNKQAANKSENRKWANKFKQTNQAIKQTKQNRQAAAFLALSHDDLFSVVFLLKGNASSVASKNSLNVTPRAQCESSFWNSAWAG